MFGFHDNKQALDLGVVYGEQWTHKKTTRKKNNNSLEVRKEKLNWQKFSISSTKIDSWSRHRLQQQQQTIVLFNTYWRE